MEEQEYIPEKEHLEYSQDYILGDIIHMRPCMHICEFIEQSMKDNDGLEFKLKKGNSEVWKPEGNHASIMKLLEYVVDMKKDFKINITTSGYLDMETLEKYNQGLGKIFLFPE